MGKAIAAGCRHILLQAAYGRRRGNKGSKTFWKRPILCMPQNLSPVDDHTNNFLQNPVIAADEKIVFQIACIVLCIACCLCFCAIATDGSRSRRASRKSPWRMEPLECMAPRLWYAERANAATCRTRCATDMKAIVCD